ncbi:curli production assembly/transport component CsgG [Alcanivorax hongdengensis A-11-3]|uniref:Curli production assembly/transport component CsgG n=2 Tax=Alcanivorax hongdengensis TaxID=519051 RepID=L0WIH3_9GAMM|nr:curli production assembly/transport component CsgG [Alcanivorax hongdengensis A-11-3]
MLASLGGCVTPPLKNDAPALVQKSEIGEDLEKLPPPRGVIKASVYSFRDLTGQYRPAPASSFSTAVTQGAAAYLVDALNRSGWFVTLEREGLQDLLTERKIARAVVEKRQQRGVATPDVPDLMSSDILFQGGIIAYETNIQTGGLGARYLGVGASDEYRADQVTVNLRAVDVRTGRIINTVSTTKKIYSKELQMGVFRFIEFKKLLEAEAGVTSNEPVQECVKLAIESAVANLIVKGVKDGNWSLKDPADMKSPVIQTYLTTLAGGAE